MENIPYIPSDLTPPPLIALNVLDKNCISIVSNEPIDFKSASYFSRENIDLVSVESEENSIIINLKEEMIPGFEYCSEFRIEDEWGNSLSFIASYYGYNPNLPQLLINEFTVEGTTTNPDKLELYILESGNMAGITIFNGSNNNYDYKFTFPSIDVKKEDYIVIRATSDDYPKAYIETDDLNVENDSKFIEGVRDIRVNDFKFSATNGTITLYSDPFGKLLDAVVYSKNLNDPTKNYRNFGLSVTLNRIDEVGDLGGWFGSFDLIFPEDSIYVEDSTTTRSLNRLDFIDTNRVNEWYTVATRESTFGFLNSKVYY